MHAVQGHTSGEQHGFALILCECHNNVPLLRDKCQEVEELSLTCAARSFFEWVGSSASPFMWSWSMDLLALRPDHPCSYTLQFILGALFVLGMHMCAGTCNGKLCGALPQVENIYNCLRIAATFCAAPLVG